MLLLEGRMGPVRQNLRLHADAEGDIPTATRGTVDPDPGCDETVVPLVVSELQDLRRGSTTYAIENTRHAYRRNGVAATAESCGEAVR